MKNLFLFLLFSHQVFSINAANYYINDATYNGDDIFVTAVGNNANDGLTAGTPKLTFANLWATYGPAGTNVITNGDIIYIDAGTYTSASAVVGTCNCGFTFANSITIRGAGKTKTIFDNNYVGIAGSYYFANITAGVTIRDIQFRKYASNQNGQAIQIAATGVTLQNVILNQNGGSSMYAPLYIGANSTVTITGGGMLCNGDAGHGASGGIDIRGTGITVTITNMAFIGNYKTSASAIGHGAALTITSADGTTDVSVSNCLFYGNNPDNDAASGGAIYATTGDLTLTDCILEYNDTYELSVKYGGAAYFTGGTQQFTRVLVRNNTNSGGSTYGTVSVHGGTLTLTNCRFEGNTSDRGKDIYCKSGSITATNTAFASAANQTATYGGTITLTNCDTPTDQYSSGTFTNNGGASPAFTTPTVPTYTGTCGGSNVVLPIELLFFKAKKLDQRLVELFWSTASEHNNDYFTIEKTLNGLDYINVGNVNGSGTSFVINNYSLLDYQPQEDVIIYYRLKQTDFDGNYSYSDIISVASTDLDLKEIISVTNILGQKVNEQFIGLVLIHYSDGSSSKKIQG